MKDSAEQIIFRLGTSVTAARLIVHAHLMGDVPPEVNSEHALSGIVDLLQLALERAEVEALAYDEEVSAKGR